MNPPRLALSALAILLAGGVWGQTRPDRRQVLTNMSFLTDSVETDKATYLAGEEVGITIRVRNPTGRSLIVPEVFDPSVNSAYCGRVVNGRVENPIDTIGGDRLTETTPLETLAPGQEKVLRFWSSDDDRSGARVNHCALNGTPGLYGAAYDYKGASARFRVLPPGIFEAFGEARYPQDRTVQYHADDPPWTFPWYRWVFSLQSGNTSYFYVPRSGSQAYRQAFTSGRPLPYEANEITASMLSPFKVVATSPVPIVEIQATMDNSKNLTVIYRDANGTQRRLDLDDALNPR